MNKQEVVNEMLDFIVKHWTECRTSARITFVATANDNRYEAALSFVKDYATYHGIKVDPVEIRKVWRDCYGLTDS